MNSLNLDKPFSIIRFFYLYEGDRSPPGFTSGVCHSVTVSFFPQIFKATGKQSNALNTPALK